MYRNSARLPHSAGHSKPRCTDPSSARVLLGMETLIRRTSLISFVVPRCELQKPARSIVHCVRRTASGCAQEIGTTSPRAEPGCNKLPKHAPKSSGNGTSSTLRDRLTLLIRQHQLDPALVKLYAVDFCGVRELRNASRELVKDFVDELATRAAKDRNSLLCKLNAYAPKQEGAA
jgi:hypothetical protein